MEQENRIFRNAHSKYEKKCLYTSIYSQWATGRNEEMCELQLTDYVPLLMFIVCV